MLSAMYHPGIWLQRHNKYSCCDSINKRSEGCQNATACSSSSSSHNNSIASQLHHVIGNSLSPQQGGGKSMFFFSFVDGLIPIFHISRPLHNIGPSRLWVPLLGIASHLRICPAPYTSSLKLLFLPGLEAPLSSYLEVALYKFHR